MGNAQWVLELALLLLLAATLFHAHRLERALGILKRDRAVLEELVVGFNDSTRQAESGVEKLRDAADGAGRQIGRQIESAQLLRDDLTFLTTKSDRLAERLEAAVRSARMFADREAFASCHLSGHPSPADVLQSASTLTLPTRPPQVSEPLASTTTRGLASSDDRGADVGQTRPRLRSQAERDLLRVLRTAR